MEKLGNKGGDTREGGERRITLRPRGDCPLPLIHCKGGIKHSQLGVEKEGRSKDDPWKKKTKASTLDQGHIREAFWGEGVGGKVGF